MYLQLADVVKQEGNFKLGPINFSLQAGCRLAIMGATGSGKSTLLKIIAGLVQADAGTVYFNGARVKGPEEKLLPGHQGIAYLSQHFELRNNYRVKDELSYTNQLTEEEASTIFEVCRIEHLLERWTHQLSGGERQRIAMARQLISAPKLFLLDEPFSNLDPLHKEIIKTVIEDIGGKLQVTCILVSHEPHDVLPWADEILILQEGLLAQKASPGEIYQHPANAYVAGLLGRYNLIESKDMLLFKAWGIGSSTNKSLLVRPEQLVITVNDTATICGTTKKISFYGAFYEVEIQIEHLMLIACTTKPTTKPGDVVAILLDGSPYFV